MRRINPPWDELHAATAVRFAGYWWLDATQHVFGRRTGFDAYDWTAERLSRWLNPQPFANGLNRAHRDDPARALAVLSGQLDRPGEIAEQLASRQDLVSSPTVMEAATALYIDPVTKKPKRGAGGAGRGSPRRLAEILLQFDLTYDIYGMGAAELLDLLPAEFDRFRSEPI